MYLCVKFRHLSIFLSPVPRPFPARFLLKKAGAPFPDPRFLKHLPRTTQLGTTQPSPTSHTANTNQYTAVVDTTNI